VRGLSLIPADRHWARLEGRGPPDYVPGREASVSFYGVKQMACTLCGARFPLVSGSLVHPADVLCDACVLGLWDRLPTETPAQLKAWVEARVQPRMGMMPDILSQAIIDRVERLQDMVSSRVELENMLAHRGVLGG
jgi:hypothetical protein